jgi:aromatic-L-amino-acid decarboxylase
VGTTSSGAIDNIEEVGQVCMRSFFCCVYQNTEIEFPVTKYPDIWLHIDAAWAGVALACPEFREISYLNAINQYAHSFCTNFHKVNS